MAKPDSTWSASSAFRHPLWLCALVVLVLNDHYFKHAHVLPGWVTGKLSDFAGLLVAPVLFAWLVRARSRAAWIACHLSVGLGFALLEIPSIARFVSIPGLVRMWPDATDLLALPMLAISAWVFRPREAAMRASFASLPLGVIALIACTATSAPAPQFVDPHSVQTLIVHNETNASLPILVRESHAASCDQQPSAPELGEARSYTVEPGGSVDVWHRTTPDACSSFLLSYGSHEWFVRWTQETPGPAGALIIRDSEQPPRLATGELTLAEQ